MKYSFLIMFVVLSAFQCDDRNTQPTGGEIAGKWKFKYYSSTQKTNEYGVSFEISTEPVQTGVYRVSGRSSVNAYFGSCTYDKTKGEIKIAGLASTKMAGSPEAMAFEDKYLGNLEKSVRYSIDSKGELTISLSESSESMIFEKTQ